MIVVRGGPTNASSVFLQGNVVFSLPEAMSVKRVCLRLYATLRLNWTDAALLARNPNAKPIRFERILYEHEWNNLEAGSTNTAPSPTSSTHTLSAGNHALPFEAILPGSIDESVEGLEGGQVVYKLVATIERGRFANNLVTKKHLRVVRTLGPDALELSQTMSMENLWPNKVQYSISVPAKAIAVGSHTPLDMCLTPLLKGLKLGNTIVHLVEYKTLTTAYGSSIDSETNVAELIIPPPEDGFEGHDEWIVHRNFMIPSSLSKCTQDCQIGSYIKVTHKLKFAISLCNPDGHTSELRASLPVCLFISPNVAITSLHPTLSGPSQATSSSSSSAPRHSRSNSFVDEDQLFASTNETQVGSLGQLTGAELNAPPNYQDHIYDALWGEIPLSQLESPFASEPSTPFTQSRRNSTEAFENSGFGPQDRSRLLSNLYALQDRQNREDSGNINSVLERSNQVVSIPGSSSSASNIIAAATAHTSRLSSRSNSGTTTPREITSPFNLQITANSNSANSTGSHTPNFPDFNHLSHPASPSISTTHSPSSELDLESLSRVPSYETAIHSGPASIADYTPSYNDPGSFSSPGSLPRNSISSSIRNNNSNSMTNISSNAAFQRQQNTLNSSALSAPGSSVHLSSLTAQLARTSLPSTSSEGNTSTRPDSVSSPHSRTSSSTNLSAMANQGSSSNGIFRSSSKTHLSSLNGTSRPSSGLTNANRSSSSRSLFDEASKLLRMSR